jgi:hypothetical protein
MFINMNYYRKVRIPVFLSICILAIVILIIPISADTINPIKNTTNYEATWDGPFFTIILGKMAGYFPSYFTFTEVTWKNRHGGEEFYMGLDDDGGKAWMRLHSDKIQESALWLPRSPKEVLNFDVIRFVRTLRSMFIDSSRHTMRGIFTFSKKKLFAEAREYALSQEEENKFKPARAFTILTFDTTGAPGIGGRVVIAVDSVLHYKKVVVNLPVDEIEITLEEQIVK